MRSTAVIGHMKEFCVIKLFLFTWDQSCLRKDWLINVPKNSSINSQKKKKKKKKIQTILSISILTLTILFSPMTQNYFVANKTL